MIKKILLCEPNISEGVDETKISQITEALTKTPGVVLIDVHSDKDHNRTVYTYMGSPEIVLEATKNLAERALDLIDMTKHIGSHPRMGAVDVVPFVIVRNMEKQEALDVAYDFGKFLGSKGVPVYFHEDAAKRPERKRLADIRKGQYEAIEMKMKDEAWRPDEGPFVFVPKSGVTATGVRFHLVAFNINLNTDDIAIGNNIARFLRHSSGGFRFCRAIALPLKDRNMIQVSINLDNYEKTPIPIAFDLVNVIASHYGVSIAEAELIGPVPMAALRDVVRYCLRVHSFDTKQIIESHLLD